MVSQGETYAGMGREMRAMTVGKSDERPKGDRMFSLAERAAKAFGGNRRTGSVWIRSDHRLLGGRTPRAVAEASEEGLAEALQALEADQRFLEILATPSIQLALLRVLRATDTVVDVIKEPEEAAHSKVRMGWWRVLQLMGTDASIAEEVPETTGRDNDGEDYAGGAWLDLAPELGAKAQRLLGRTAGRKWMRTPHPALYGVAPYTHVVREWSDAKAMEVLERDWTWLDNPDDPDVDPAWLEVLESLGATSGKSPKGEVYD